MSLPQPERVKSRLPSRLSQRSPATSDGTTAPAIPVQLIHQTLSVILLWHPGQPTSGLAWTENAYLALIGIAASQLELFHTGVTELADQGLTKFLHDLHMDCDTASYESWRHIVTGLWRNENEESKKGRGTHSIQRLLNATHLSTPPKDCMGTVCALGLMPSDLPSAPEVWREHPINPLFLLKRRYPRVRFDEISTAFDTEVDEKAFHAWDQRMNAIMQCMGPITSQPILLEDAYGAIQPGVTYAEFFKSLACAICNLGETRAEPFRLDEALLNVARSYAQARTKGLPAGTPENVIADLHCELIRLVFVQLNKANLATKTCQFKAFARVSYLQAKATFVCPRKFFLVLIPLFGLAGGRVKINDRVMLWEPGTGFILDEGVPTFTENEISYIGIYICKV
ncbi:unnamed protein product [Clonostachys rosea]|uniref:Heterokaryon incompatibility domain-containing protein n=1 Tax=Bionectria ochroleuca TaxID=29856 RepID=A0ABY6UP58_BIOOC|nr:unnamed protein product [Clonostachys rosea]